MAADFPAIGRFIRLGGGSGGAGFFVPDASPFSSISARNTWAASNPTLLLTNQTLVQVTGDGWYLWNGQQWIDGDPIVQGPPGASESLASVSTRAVPYKATSGNLEDSGLMVLADGTLVTEGSIRAGISTLELEQQYALSGAGEVMNLAAMARNNNFTFVLTRRNETGDYRPQIFTGAVLSPVTVIQSDTSQDITNPDFEFTTTFEQDLFRFQVNSVGAHNNVLAEMFLQGQTEPFWRSNPQNFVEGVQVLDFVRAVQLAENSTYRIRFFKEDGTDVVMRGNSSGVISYGIQFRLLTAQSIAFLSDIPSQLTAAQIRDALQTLTGSDRLDASAIQNIPSAQPPRTDDEIRSVVAAYLQAGTNITFDDQGQIRTINASSSGGGTNPPANADRIYYGLSTISDTTAIDLLTLTREDNPTNPDTVSSGAATAGQYFVIYTPMSHDFSSITDTVLNEPVTDLFTTRDNAQTVDTISFKSYIIGPLTAGFDESYIVSF